MPSVRELETLKSEIESLVQKLHQTKGTLAQLQKGQSFSDPAFIQKRLKELRKRREDRERKYEELYTKFTESQTYKDNFGSIIR